MPITMGAKSLDHVFKEQPAVSPTPPLPPIKPKPYPVARKAMSAADYKVARAEGMPWTAFAQQSMPSLRKGAAFPDDPNSIVCGADVEARLNQRLSEEELTWCQWALSPSGGQVKVGKSYGLLKGKDREKFEKFNCNNVAKGQNPSCDDGWGDANILSWRRNVLGELCGDRSRYTSKVICRQSSSEARFCVFENVLLDFSKMSDVSRPGRTDSRKWGKGFLATHCDRNEHSDIDYYEFYDASVNADVTRCDYVMNETVLVYGHDDIGNLGHSMSDFMNVWTMLWLAGLGNYANDVTFLNTDAIRQGHNYHDDLGKFSRHYELQFHHLLKARDFTEDRSRQRVCVKRLLFMPRPVLLYTWDGWWADMPCTLAGPSSLFQRWNLQVRQLYGLYPLPSEVVAEDRQGKVRVLFIKRSVGRAAAHMYTSRVIKNIDDVIAGLKQSISSDVVSEWIVEDLARLSFEEQVRLVGKVHMIVGVHGAGVPASMHMSVGRRNCCGVIEIFPSGEFTPIRGYGNMARRAGHHYRRLDVSSAQSNADGVSVPVEALAGLVKEVVDAMKVKPSCVLKSAMKDPYFDSVPIDPSLMKIE